MVGTGPILQMLNIALVQSTAYSLQLRFVWGTQSMPPLLRTADCMSRQTGISQGAHLMLLVYSNLLGKSLAEHSRPVIGRITIPSTLSNVASCRGTGILVTELPSRQPIFKTLDW